MKKAYFDDGGRLICLSDDPTVAGGVSVADDADPNGLFLNAGRVVSRQTFTLSADRHIIVSDGSDVATLSHLPDPCVLIIDGQAQGSAGGNFAISATEPRYIHVELGGAYRSLPLVIRADTAANLMAEVRAERDVRLAASDWTQVPDTPLTDDQKAAWTTYRTSLRNLPMAQAAANIETVEWPMLPS